MSPTSALRGGANGKVLALLAAIAISALALPGAARAAGTIYWSNYLGATISHANLESGGGGDLATPEITPLSPTGIAIDAAANRIYWADRGANAIYYSALDGSGGGRLFTAGATVSEPYGVAIDPTAGKVYWASSEEDAISWANLDGSGGGNLDTTGATLNDPRGLAIDPAANRIYWANFIGATISYANLDGSGGGDDLDVTGATVGRPTSLAIDRASGRIYWTNVEVSEGIFYASLAGGSGGELNTAGAEVSSPDGLAIDPGEGRAYWANGLPDTISHANLDNSGGGGEIATTDATADSPRFLALLKAPSGEGAPAITGQKLIERPLFCETGKWTPDLLGSFLYRAPSQFSYSWLRNGVEIAGATGVNYRPTAPGSYDCRITATNAAGSTAQTSADLTLVRGFALASGFAPVHGRKALVTLTCVGDGRCKGLVKLIAHVGYKRIVHREGRREVIRRRALFPVGKASFSIFPGRTKVLRVKLKRKGKRLLDHKPGHRMRVRLLGRDVQHRGLLLKAGGSPLARTGQRRSLR
jgi:DNA-binding beta-propeller fold protein YncE